MMERFLLGAWVISGWVVLSLCLEHHYHFVNQNLNWTEAKTYCRKHYTDLASIRNSEDMKHFIKNVSSTGYSSEIWIGLYSEIDWMWSGKPDKRSPEYRNWETSDGDPDFISASQFCVCIGDSGGWWDYNCETKLPFVCNKGTSGRTEFVLVNEKMSWSDAQRYCQDKFVDLANIGNSTENQQVQKLVPTGNWAWTGLHRNENIYWSDQSSFVFRNWANVSNQIGSREVICGAVAETKLATWRFLPCEDKRPFVCYRFTEKVMRRVVRLELKIGDSWNLTDSNLKNKLLRELHKKLQENAPLKFLEQPDGKVFKVKKKTEL
ncbi:C-type mannose receptor 2 [Fundulus heteroclitus]|uniref:C-type mannose receptor 2 n=1 Tax=Fundulus heteroclitus TaxID=8078 RepID=UPI00165BD814|nr:C-type mannose receptor 2 [Fundulus heteroclitus]